MKFIFNGTWPEQYASIGLIDDVVSAFKSESEGLIGEISTMLQSYDDFYRHELTSKIHKLKGFYRNLGIDSLHHVLKISEEMTSQGDNHSAWSEFECFLKHREEHERLGIQHINDLTSP